MKKLRLTMALVFMIVLVFGVTKQTLTDLAVGPSQIDFGEVCKLGRKPSSTGR
jgi:hypothetical protein